MLTSVFFGLNMTGHLTTFLDLLKGGEPSGESKKFNSKTKESCPAINLFRFDLYTDL